ncbi:TELO2-interacting protein 1 homolog isoform X2 [Cylas formicarius]|uniref:TELO2-interacting protein 1 homolog isoform X2 n=1 Tax=Cylas formicarius TaxID=197179 RepID=UPI002958323A|nr:TELO2-interacting protein 1 homolog isoform X2 [Cylas formicarius]
MGPSFDSFLKLQDLCHAILKNPDNLNSLKDLKFCINQIPRNLIEQAHKPLLASFYAILKMISVDKNRFPVNKKQIFVDTLKEFLNKASITSEILFFNIYSFLLFELYDYSQHKTIPEEYKIMLLQCMTALLKSISPDIFDKIYNKENIPKISQIVFVCGDLAKQEKSKEIKYLAIVCVMALGKVSDSDDYSDIVLRCKVAEVFMFFLPGIVSALCQVIVDSIKSGHKVLTVAIKAFGRIVSIVAQNYEPNDTGYLPDLVMLKEAKSKIKVKWKNKEEIDKYINTTKRTLEWYKTTDENLQASITKLIKITSHENMKVRLELIEMISHIVSYCHRTLPLSIASLIEFLIILSEDDTTEVSDVSKSLMNDLSNKLSSTSLVSTFESLKEGYYNSIQDLPRVFNNADDHQKIIALNLIIGYVKLFGETDLKSIMSSPVLLNVFIDNLVHISKLQISQVSILEEITIKEIVLVKDFKQPWINFLYFRDETIKNKLDQLCALLSKSGCLDLLYNSLMDRFDDISNEHRKEIQYLLNAMLVPDLDVYVENPQILKNLIQIYTEKLHYQLSIVECEGYTPEELKETVVFLCLLVEGIGKLSLTLKDKFIAHLLHCLYVVLRCAGCRHPLLQKAGLSTIAIITYSCGYADFTELVSTNFDYFSYHVERKLLKADERESALNVLSVVLNHCTKDIFQYLSNIVEGILENPSDIFQIKHATPYLKVLRMCVISMRRWFPIEEEHLPIKSRSQKQDEYEEYHVSGIRESENFSDDIMEGKTAEEMYKEDVERKANENEEMDMEPDTAIEYQKPEPPQYVSVATTILQRSLHFLPSKDRSRKLLVLEILSTGIEILKDWEDQLLPTVHQIWSPLVQRFTESEGPLIISYSFDLLLILAKLSKDFIRMRTVKEVLPNLLQLLEKLSRESYLKDKGAAFRYTQKYKLQIKVLDKLGYILAYLDVQNEVMEKCMECAFLYLSDKQPQPLQVSALNFFNIVIKYDLGLVVKITKKWNDKFTAKEYQRNVEQINHMINMYERQF